MKADPKQPSEIIPPDASDGDASASATANAGEHLRMPHFIDQARDWRHLISAPRAALSALANLMRRAIDGLVYRLTLTLLLATAIGVIGFGIWQARHMQLPQFDSFWHSIKPDNIKTPNIKMSSGETGLIETGDTRPDSPAKIMSQDDAAGFQPSGELRDLQERLSALQKAPQYKGQTPLVAPPISQQAQAALAEERAAHEATRAQLLATQDKLAALNATRANAGAADETLVARAALGDLLLRLDSGAAYDDVLEGGALARVLRRSEWALLALYADSGVPTRAALLARFEIWLDGSAGFTNNGTIDKAPDGYSDGFSGGFYTAVLDWLRHRSGGLVQVREAPLATAGEDIERIATALQRGRHDEAAWRLGALLRRLDSDAGLSHPDRAGLQLLYDDVSAAAELSPMLAALRDDYIAGVRP
jgi:hypothetical protein